MTRTSLDDALWASLMLTVQQIPRAREIPQGLSLGSATRRRCGASSRLRCGSAGRVRRGATCPTTWAIGPASITASGVGRCAAGGSWCSRRCARLCPRTGWCCWTARHTLRNAQRLRRGAPRRVRCCAQRRRGGVPRLQPRRPVLEAARLRRRRGPHPAARAKPRPALRPAPCTGPRFGHPRAQRRPRPRLRIGQAARRACGRGLHRPHPAQARHGRPATLGQDDLSRKRFAFRRARRHHVENLFSKLKDWNRIALRRDKTRRSWMGFAHLAAAVINLRVTEFSHRP